MDSHSPRSRLFVTFGRVRWQVSERVHDCRCVSPWDASGAPSRRPSVDVYPQQLSTNTAQHCTQLHYTLGGTYTGRPLTSALRATLHSLTPAAAFLRAAILECGRGSRSLLDPPLARNLTPRGNIT